MTENSQFADRYTVKEAIDEVLDAIREAGPSEDEHYAALDRIAEAKPRFFVALSRLAAHYVNDQTDEPGEATVKAAVALAGDESAVDAFREVGAERLEAGFVKLRVALRREGAATWEDHTPDA